MGASSKIKGIRRNKSRRLYSSKLMDMEDSEAPRAASRNGAAIDGKRKWSGSSKEEIKHGEK